MSAIAIAIDVLQHAAVVTDITTADGLYPIDLPERAAPPCCVINIIAGVDEHTLSGAGQYYDTRISVECLALEATQASNLDKAVLGALQDVIKADVLDCTDVDISFADTEWTDKSDDRLTFRFGRHYRVRWRSAA